jgi:hypothetical protein
MTEWRRVSSEYEAKLYKVPLPRLFRNSKGELEHKTYADGEESLEIAFRGAKVPDGTMVSVVIDGKPICDVEVRRGRGRVDLSSVHGHQIPSVSEGDIGEIQYVGQALLRGVFRSD